jgi:hypothetical protein
LAKAQKERDEREVGKNISWCHFKIQYAKWRLFHFIFQVVRQKNASALKIQCCFRSFTARKRAKNVMRNKFDALRGNYKTNDELRYELISHLLYIYDIDQDGQRLVRIIEDWEFTFSAISSLSYISRMRYMSYINCFDAVDSESKSRRILWDIIYSERSLKRVALFDNQWKLKNMT